MPYKNKEVALQYAKKWRQEHKLKQQAYFKKYHQEHNTKEYKDKRAEYIRDYLQSSKYKTYKENKKEHIKQYNQLYTINYKSKRTTKIIENKHKNYVNNRLKQIRSKSKKCNIDFNLTEDWILAHFSQGCEMTGKNFELDSKSPWSAQVDRINPLKGYTMDNCRIVCKIYNITKHTWTDNIVKEFINLVGPNL